MWAERKRKAMAAAAAGKLPISVREKGGHEPLREGDEMPEARRSRKRKTVHAR
jgi:hypothetical protein